MQLLNVGCGLTYCNCYRSLSFDCLSESGCDEINAIYCMRDDEIKGHKLPPSPDSGVPSGSWRHITDY